MSNASQSAGAAAETRSEAEARRGRRQTRAAAVDAEALRARADASGRGALIQGTSPQLSGAQRRRLRALGNPLQALVHVGQHGWSEALAWAVEEALMNHELVKVRVLETSPETIPATALWIHEVLEAEVVQWLGRTLLVWRPHPTRPRIHPGAA